MIYTICIDIYLAATAFQGRKVDCNVSGFLEQKHMPDIVVTVDAFFVKHQASSNQCPFSIFSEYRKMPDTVPTIGEFLVKDQPSSMIPQILLFGK